MNEEKGKEFLNYIAKNGEELKKEFQRGIRYKKDRYDDLFQDCIIKVYNAIINGADVKNFKQYFYISLRCLSIYGIDRELRIERFEDHKELKEVEDEEYKETSITKLNNVRKAVKEEFGERYYKIFFDYMDKKYNKELSDRMNYAKYSEISGLSFTEIYEVISKVKKYLKRNKHIIKDGLD